MIIGKSNTLDIQYYKIDNTFIIINQIKVIYLKKDEGELNLNDVLDIINYFSFKMERKKEIF